ncbi:MAG: hypothetical protein QXT64_07775 [Desulfurococcaceae archaeon]
MLGIKKERKPVKWVLKAKPPDSSSWEDIETYDEPKTYSDLKDVIDGLRDDGYEGVRLDAYDKNNRFVRHEFVRYFTTAKQINSYKSLQRTFQELLTNQINMFNEMIKYQTELMKTLKEIGSSKPGYEDAIAQILYLKELEREIANALGLSTSGVSMSAETQKILLDVVMDLVKTYMPELREKFAEKYLGKKEATKIATPTPTPVPTPPISLPEPPKEIYDRLDQIAQRVEEALKPPCMKGETCLEGVEAQ